MSRVLNISLSILLMMAISSTVFAEESKGDMMDGKDMMGGKGMMMKQCKMMGMCPMYKMMRKEMVAIEDGGVIVMVGNKLLKYDKDLNLKKEVEIKMDIEGMQKMMKEMMGKCPMRKMMMQEGGMTGEAVEKPEASAESGEPSEHSDHH